jgi:hypothetical protein
MQAIAYILSSIALATIVIKKPACEYAAVAMAELDSLLGIFRQAADNRRVQRCLVSIFRAHISWMLNLHSLPCPY